MHQSRLFLTPSGHRSGGSTASYPSCPPGFSTQKPPPARSKDGKPLWAPRQHEGGTGDWRAARQLLQGIVTPSQERRFAASRPADAVASGYLSFLQAANHVSFTFGHALELEERLRARGRDAAEANALREELGMVKAELADTKRAAAVREFLASKEYARALAEHALEGYEPRRAAGRAPLARPPAP